jgi:Mrp family chromosome partitioning ATPase
VIFDTPPVLAVVDALVLGRACDATVLVARATSTRAGMLRRARDQVIQSGAHLLGVVLNGIAASRRDAYYYSYTPANDPRRPPGEPGAMLLRRNGSVSRKLAEPQ